VIENRARELAQYLASELSRISAITLWTNPGPTRSAEGPHRRNQEYMTGGLF
jgi:hypothetical protein